MRIISVQKDHIVQLELTAVAIVACVKLEYARLLQGNPVRQVVIYTHIDTHVLCTYLITRRNRNVNYSLVF